MLLGLVLTAPAAAAARVEVELHVPQPPLLLGGATWTASVGITNLTAAADGAAIRVTWSGGSAYEVTRTRERIGIGQAGPYLEDGAPSNESFRLGPGGLDAIRCDSQCLVAAYVRPGGDLVVDGVMDGRPGIVGEPLRFDTGASRAQPDSFFYPVPHDWINLSSTSQGPFVSNSVKFTGSLGIVLMGAKATLSQPQGASELDTTRRDVTEREAGLIALRHREELRYVVLEIEGAEIVIDPDAPVTTYASAPSVSLDGSMRTETARGHVAIDGQRTTVEDESVRIDGQLDLFLSSARTGALGARDASVLGAGAATLVSVGQTPLERGAAISLPAAVGLAALLMLVIGGLRALLDPSSFLFLYTRLQRDTLLRNPNRGALYERIKAQPGATLAELVRSTGMTPIVARHHLRHLLAHRFIGMRATNREKGYFALDGKVDAHAILHRVALKDETRKAIATRVHRAGRAVSQKELSEACGISPRLVSYHLAKLETEGLVVGGGSMPRRYEATERLAAVLEEREASAA